MQCVKSEFGADSPAIMPRPVGLGRRIQIGAGNSIETVNFPVCLAPMVGLSHVALRLAIRRYLPATAITLWPTEMLNSRRIPGENLETTPETMRSTLETHLVPQILGNEEPAIAKSVERLLTWGASGIDINMGCPVKKALKHNYGVALMGDPQYAAEVVGMTVRNTMLPVSVKLRAVEAGDTKLLLEFVRGIERAGASWICLHPRTAAQKRRGTADWSQIREVRQQINIPVIGNGDIQTAEDILAMLEETQCDMVMVGRALTARPWLLWQIGEELGWPNPSDCAGKAPRSPLEEGAEYGKFLLSVLGAMRTYFNEDLGMRKFRFLVRTGGAWLLFGHDLYARATKAKNYAELEETLLTFFSHPQEMMPRTELRQ